MNSPFELLLSTLWVVFISFISCEGVFSTPVFCVCLFTIIIWTPPRLPGDESVTIKMSTRPSSGTCLALHDNIEQRNMIVSAFIRPVDSRRILFVYGDNSILIFFFCALCWVHPLSLLLTMFFLLVCFCVFRERVDREWKLLHTRTHYRIRC